MPKIDEQLLRRRAEHNDGELSSLKEVTLHQFDIEKIENLDLYCRNLEILYLQGNQISKIENLHKLKRLSYLQLALNNIKVIENLESCESLSKLDLTVNFVENPICVESLKGNIHLAELFLVGNPCTQIDGYREFVVTALPQLKYLDGTEIEKSERIRASQEFPAIRERLLKLQKEQQQRDQQTQAGQTSAENTAEAAPASAPSGQAIKETDDLDAKRHEFQTVPVPHTPEARLSAARDLALMKGEKVVNAADLGDPMARKKAEPVLFASDGRVLQKNEGKYSFKWTSSAKTITLSVDISKFLDTSLIDVDVHPTWLRIIIKGKILQLLIEEEVHVDGVVCERSRLTGQLAITMLKAAKAEGEADVIEVRRQERLESETAALAAAAKAAEADRKQAAIAKTRNRRLECLDYRNIVDHSKLSASHAADKGKPELSRSLAHQRVALQTSGHTKITDTRMIQGDIEPDDDFVDDPSVPPLC
ncbi:hypothetical protein BC831DRAFT_455977 [Entophlyctis helioformis]|nr:hypothetical protein BC831DRAFT_455977 [Entophlyctis helioformis]